MDIDSLKIMDKRFAEGTNRYHNILERIKRIGGCNGDAGKQGH
jgi:hypothetical protein